MIKSQERMTRRSISIDDRDGPLDRLLVVVVVLLALGGAAVLLAP